MKRGRKATKREKGVNVRTMIRKSRKRGKIKGDRGLEGRKTEGSARMKG